MAGGIPRDAVGWSRHPASTPKTTNWCAARRALGDFELIFCRDGTYLLDGGAMFGVVPKVLWAEALARRCGEPDTAGSEYGGGADRQAVVVIETGIGNKQSAKMREIHRNQELLPASLAAAGVRVEEVTHVINTHLHFDHCGWNTTLHADGFGDADISECALLCCGGRAGAWAAAAGA